MIQAAICIARPISMSCAARTRPQPRLPAGASRLKTTRQSSFGKLLSVIGLSGETRSRKALGKCYANLPQPGGRGRPKLAENSRFSRRSGGDVVGLDLARQVEIAGLCA